MGTRVSINWGRSLSPASVYSTPYVCCLTLRLASPPLLQVTKFSQRFNQIKAMQLQLSNSNSQKQGT